eukprot:scaffold7206_cov500-Prasinococcus_capsulatus_cf.AAC.1
MSVTALTLAQISRKAGRESGRGSSTSCKLRVIRFTLSSWLSPAILVVLGNLPTAALIERVEPNTLTAGTPQKVTAARHGPARKVRHTHGEWACRRCVPRLRARPWTHPVTTTATAAAATTKTTPSAAPPPRSRSPHSARREGRRQRGGGGRRAGLRSRSEARESWSMMVRAEL